MKVREAEGEKRLGEPKFENGSKGEMCCSGNDCFFNVTMENVTK